MRQFVKTSIQRLIPILFVFMMTLSVAAQEEVAAAEETATSGMAIGMLMIFVGVGAVMLVGLLLNQSESANDEE